MNFNIENNSIMQDKVYLQQLTETVDICNSKCIKNYLTDSLTTREQQCLEKCYFKTINLNKELSNNFGDLMLEIEKN